jgi:hypothetical protein
MSLAATRRTLFGSAATAAHAKAIVAIAVIHRNPCAPAFMVTLRSRFGIMAGRTRDDYASSHVAAPVGPRRTFRYDCIPERLKNKEAR